MNAVSGVYKNHNLCYVNLIPPLTIEHELFLHSEDVGRNW